MTIKGKSTFYFRTILHVKAYRQDYYDAPAFGKSYKGTFLQKPSVSAKIKRICMEAMLSEIIAALCGDDLK